MRHVPELGPVLIGEVLLVRVAAELWRAVIHQEYRRIIIFETAKQFIEQLLRGRGSFDRWAIDINEALRLIEGQGLSEFFHAVH
jgi:hypothetical protein